MVLRATLRTGLSMTMASSPTTITPRRIHRLRWIADVSTGPSRTPESFRADRSRRRLDDARARHYRYGTGPYRNLFLGRRCQFSDDLPAVRLERHVRLAELAGGPVDQQRKRDRGVLADELDRRRGGAAARLERAQRALPGPGGRHPEAAGDQAGVGRRGHRHRRRAVLPR